MLKAKSAALILAVGVFVLGGCHSNSSMMSCPISKIQNAPPDELNDSPLVVDGAMQLRDWQRAEATYANGDTPAGPTGFNYEPAWNQSGYRYPIVETPLFIGQTLLLPVTLTMNPPWTEKVYTGATIGTTYNGMPALPGASEVPDTAVVQPTTQP
jgi:hypothetical protein